MIRFAKFLLRCLLRLLYKVEVTGLEHYQEAGDRVLIIANHTSLLDGVFLYAWFPETPTFAINTQIASRTSYRFYLRYVDLFNMDPNSPLSIKSMIKFLKEDHKAVIFPEGRITLTGSLMKIYEGPGMIAEKSGAMVLPISIDGAQFSPYSYRKGRGRIIRFPRIKIKILPPEKIHIDPSIQGHARRKAAAMKLQDLMYKLTYTAFNYRTTVFDALLTAADRYGHDLTIVEDIHREPLNYRQLITRSMILACPIRQDTQKDEYVGVLLPNVIATLVTFLALQYLGRVPAMLNYTVGVQALLKACETGQLNTIYTSKRFIENANLQEIAQELSQRYNLVYLEDLRERITLFDKCLGLIRGLNPARHYRHIAGDIDPDKPGVILFTSGSEGVPKGVVLSHSNMLSNYAQVSCHIDFQPQDIMFTCLPLFHTFGLNGGFLMPLLGGSKIFLYPTPLHFRAIPELVYELGATILFGSNTFLKGYARHAHPYDFNSLRYAVAGAEKLHQDTQQTWMEKFGIRILQGYGVTETSPVISVNTPMNNKMGTTGRIMSDMEYYLQSVDGIDEGGRLVVRGPNVMLGYLLHDSNGEIIPPATDRGPGWYDTGDIASFDDEGFLTILGRAKRFAKIGGEMVSLTAVEELAMMTWPDFSHAAVNLPDEKKGEKIVLVTNHQNADRKQILNYAKAQQYGELYIPRKILLAEELPVLGSGKTDYITLHKMALEAEETGKSWIAKITRLVKKPETPNKKANVETEEQSEDNGNTNLKSEQD
jgi:acyl-[acyl-carrier-protein]-phospholipid O-acyltransferase/long-chain-fatty-acid--[acyl-carrier-protein] ligase